MPNILPFQPKGYTKRLSEINAEYLIVMQMPKGDQRDYKLRDLMNVMESEFNVRNGFMTRDPEWERKHPQVRELYEKISDSRSIWEITGPWWCARCGHEWGPENDVCPDCTKVVTDDVITIDPEEE